MLRSIGKQSGKQIVAAYLLPHSLMYVASRPRHQGNQCRIIVPVLATCYIRTIDFCCYAYHFSYCVFQL